MSQVGKQVTLTELNNTSADVIIRLRGVLQEGRHLETWINDQSDSDLEAIGITDPDDIFLIRAALQDLGHFSRIWDGVDTQASVHDFNQYTGKLTGVS